MDFPKAVNSALENTKEKLLKSVPGLTVLKIDTE
jgi:hypothetical protein